MKTINIHGRNYVEVNERIKYFRKKYKEWSLISEVIELTDKRCVIKASVINAKGRVISTGIAYEMLGSSYINKTSFVENCETSAWGRALGNLGIGIDTSIASADEVKNAKKQQETKPKTKEKLNNSKYQKMIIAIGEGKTDIVKERMQNYKLTKTQETTLNKLISKKNERNNIFGEDEIEEINEVVKDEIEQKKMSNISTLSDTILEYHQDEIAESGFLSSNIK